MISTEEQRGKVCSQHVHILSPPMQMFPSPSYPPVWARYNSCGMGVPTRDSTALTLWLMWLLGRVLTTKKSLSPGPYTDWVSVCPHSDRGDEHDSPLLAYAGSNADNNPLVHQLQVGAVPWVACGGAMVYLQPEQCAHGCRQPVDCSPP